MSSASWRAAWAERALALRLLGLLDARDVAQLVGVDRSSRTAIKRELRRFRRGGARLALALWCARHVRLEFQSHYQELETHSVARSRVHDPRVPPRVVSFWAERGEVPGGVVVLKPELLPKRSERGVSMRFVAAPDQRPMLTNVVQHQRRIYTVVALKIVRPRGGQGGGEEAETEIVLRRLWYLKEFGEWCATIAGTDKRRFDEHGALCRYDLVSLDGSVALELDVPRGADSMMDYFLVKRATVMLPLEELMHPFVKKLRPTRALVLTNARDPPRRCRVVLSFGGLDGAIDATYNIDAELTVEQQQQQQPSEPSHSSDAATAGSSSEDTEVTEATAPRARTGIESFDIVTVKTSSTNVPVNVPRAPGYVWLSLWNEPVGTPSGTTKRAHSLYYAATMLHGGATRIRAALELDAQWVPGTLESFPTPQSRQRRALKGFFHLSVDMDTHALRALSIVAQHLPRGRLEPYAAAIESYTRPQLS